MNEELLAVIREHTTPAEYEALLLYSAEHSHAEAAELLGISRTAYRKRLVRAKRRIRANLKNTRL